VNKLRKTYWQFAGHFSFWTLSIFVLLLVFSTSGEIGVIDIIYTVIFHFTLIPLVYLNFNFATPKFFLQKKTFIYLLVLITAIVFFSVINEMLFSRYADVLFPGYYFVSYFSLRDVIIIHFIYVIISTLVVLSGSWFREMEQKKKMIELEKENIHTELQMLKNQVNPHFFFNTLQNLYALSLKKSDQLPEMILKLSELMRYVIYEANAPAIKIGEEIRFINNYLELQKLRLPGNPNLKFEVIGDPGQIEIPPLLFIHLIENCFKHGLKGEVKNTYANISLEMDRNFLIFKTENNVRHNTKNEMEKDSGMGIENLKRRLELNYPHKYDFKITEGKTTFEVYLKIDLS